MKSERDKRINNAVLILVLYVITILMGCSSTEAINKSESSEVTVVQETETEETAVKEVEVKEEVKEAEPAPEPTPDPTPDPTPEAVTYEGIDMESTLPGGEWIQTFVGIIDEPKVVIFNDETGRKEIIENGDIVNFNPDVDLMALYLPEGVKVLRKTKGICILEILHDKDCYEINKLDAAETRNRGRQMATLYVEVDGEKVALTFDLRPE